MNRVFDVLPLEGVHVWAWSLVRGSFDLTAETRLLSSAELDRLHRFRFEADRVRYAVSHANLRRILAVYLGCPPTDLTFLTSPFGKPYLPDNQISLTFNLSHTANIAVVAVSRDFELGVDVEAVRPIEPEVAEAHFSARELDDLRTLTGSWWIQGFYNCWTRKEAVLKAEGVGLDPPLAAFDVTVLPGSPAQLLASRPAARLTNDWQLLHLEPAIGTVGALAYNPAVSEVRCFTFQP